jgi:hypothetical protein
VCFELCGAMEEEDRSNTKKKKERAKRKSNMRSN